MKHRKLRIGDHEWKIIFKKKMPDDNLGQCEWDKKEIWISKNLTDIEMFKTIVHEILHAFEDEYGFEMRHKTIYHLEKPITDFIFHNELLWTQSKSRNRSQESNED